VTIPKRLAVVLRVPEAAHVDVADADGGQGVSEPSLRESRLAADGVEANVGDGAHPRSLQAGDEVVDLPPLVPDRDDSIDHGWFLPGELIAFGLSDESVDRHGQGTAQCGDLEDAGVSGLALLNLHHGVG
jgi:hypothetical protein